MNMDQISWGILGVGKVCEMKSGPAFNLVSHSNLHAVMRRDKDKARDFAQRHQVPKWYDNADMLLQDPDVNAVYIATPPHMHAAYAIAALEHGKPVYIEKPMAMNYKECLRIMDKAQEVQLPVFVAYYRRCLPYFLNVKDWIDRGQIGEIRLVNIKMYRGPRADDFDVDTQNWRVIPSISGGGYFVDLASHQFDLLEYTLGPIISVTSQVSNQGGLYEAEDIVAATFQFESGIIGSGMWCFSTDPGQERDEIEIIGSKGKIVFPCFKLAPLHMENDQGIHEKIISHPKHVQLPLIKQVVAHLRGKGISPSTGHTASRTNKILDQILYTYYK